MHAGTWPVHLLFHQACHQATIRIASLPPSHPLYSLYWKRAKRYIKTHRSPLHELAALDNIALDSLEELDPVRHPPAYEIKAAIRVMGEEGGQEMEAEEEEGVIRL